MTETQLRDKDHVILEKINEGHNDTQKIKENTTLQNHEIRYSLKKLEKQGLIELEKPEGMVERVINGQKRVFQAPLQAQTTEKGPQHLKEQDQERIEAFSNMTHRELVERVHYLEEQVSELEQSFQVFREQVQRKM